jgi:hypothetical protein
VQSEHSEDVVIHNHPNQGLHFGGKLSLVVWFRISS